MADFVAPNSLFIDVGANLGGYAIPIAKAFPSVEVHAFDPDPIASRKFLANAALNTVPNLHHHQSAAGSRKEIKEFQSVAESELGASSFITPKRTTWKAERIRVRVERLDDVLTARVARVSVIKLDTQGYECEVLSGAQSIVRNDKPVIVFEHQDNNFRVPRDAETAKETLKSFFESHNYVVLYITQHDPNMLFPVRWNMPLEGDLLAIPIADKAAT